MAFFGIVAPPPNGQHARSDAVVPAGTGKQNKEPNALKKLLDKLSLRERIMLGTLIVLAIAAAALLLVILPAINGINELEAEIVALQEEKDGIHVEPDRTPQYQEILENALRDHENYQRFYYPFMNPETIDKTVTNMLLNNELYPTRLSMGLAEPATMPLYAAQQAALPEPVPTTEETAAEDAADAAARTGSDSGTADGTDGGDGTDGSTDDQRGRTEEMAAAAEAAESSSATPDSEDEGTTSSLIYCYTIDLEAHGWMDDLFTFLEAARGITAMEIVSYSYADPQEATTSVTSSSGTAGATGTAQGISSTKPMGESTTEIEELEGGTIIMQIKLYVYVGGTMPVSGTTSS
jgi:cell division protein FtsL